MNDKLQGSLAEILTGIQSAVKASGDFAASQLPDIAQQYITYGRAANTMYAVLFLLASAILARIARKLFNAWDGRGSVVPPLLIMCSGAACVLTSILFLCRLSDVMLVWFAPKVWLIKQLASLVGGK